LFRSTYAARKKLCPIRGSHNKNLRKAWRGLFARVVSRTE
jgi:hypothetical protein